MLKIRQDLRNKKGSFRAERGYNGSGKEKKSPGKAFFIKKE